MPRKPKVNRKYDAEECCVCNIIFDLRLKYRYFVMSLLCLCHVEICLYKQLYMSYIWQPFLQFSDIKRKWRHNKISKQNQGFSWAVNHTVAMQHFKRLTLRKYANVFYDRSLSFSPLSENVGELINSTAILEHNTSSKSTCATFRNMVGLVTNSSLRVLFFWFISL